MSDLQLERSVLEAKERDELFAIAQALGSSPGPRTKKADLVSQILQVTGVDQATSPAVEKPRRTRVKKAAAPGQEPVEQLELTATNGKSRSRNGSRASATEARAEVALERQEREEATPEVDDLGLSSFSSNGNGQVHAETSPGEAGETAHVPQRTATNGRARLDRDRPDQRQDRSDRPDQRQDRAERPDLRGDLDPGLGNSRRRRRRNREKSPRGSESRERDFTAQPEVPYSGELVPCSGMLDLREEGYGFLRTNGYLASSSDVYVSITQVRRYGLRKGDVVEGAFRPAANNEKYPALVRVDSVSGLVPEDARGRPKFESLTPLFPDEKLSLEVPGDPANVTARIVDLVSPIGKGQRGMIVSPPKAGKTTILKQIAHSIEANNPEVHLMILLVDERPEEVTDWRRSVKGEVIASTFDRPSDEHTQVAELAIERAKRLLEVGRDVVIVLDGITRLARAYNLAQPATGRIMSGGIDTGALYPPKKFFGSARNIEEGGSLTILATALVETGSRMDEVIFEEFKGTGNMELRLDRKLAERRIYPALDVNASSTRHEELLFDRNQLQQVWKLRRVLNALATDGNAAAGLELLVDKIRTTRSNDQFLAEIAKTPAPAI
ncbi:MAG TPA: transcription termination factor Rho [Acidimicrobiales bacterium]|nr:transcription termination factor Rho [Acidimicrobiales bacterium]